MSGNEQAFQADPKFDPNDVEGFISTGYSGAEQLKKAKIYSSSTGRIFVNDQDQNIGAIVEAFNAWKDKKTKVKESHSAYVKATQDTPGRKATILTDPSKTILGMPKTFL